MQIIDIMTNILYNFYNYNVVEATIVNDTERCKNKRRKTK